jgi:hypothetical protein
VRNLIKEIINMAKVGRAAYAASRQRVETLGNGTSAPTAKTIGTAETGEIYLINHNHASALTITLPAMQNGAYFKFIWKLAMSDNTATVVFNSADNTAGDFAGTIIEQVPDAADGVTSTETAGSHDILTIGSANDTSIGSWLEVVCDGSTWWWTGTIINGAAGNAVFSS